MPSPRYLSKSRFKLALDCPAKLYYTGKKEYPDQKIDDKFLEALAQGGFQVGELAKCYFPDGIEIHELDYETALKRTAELLERENVVIFEAAFLFDNLFIRADVVVKQGTHIDLYEVKAKSIDSTTDSLSNAKGIAAPWKPYVYDVVFQKYVIAAACPRFTVSAHLMLADKSKTATVDGLNQKFLVRKDAGNRTAVQINGDVSPAALGQQILCSINIDHLHEDLFAGKPLFDENEKSFQQWVHYFADHYAADELVPGALKGKCGKCEFRATPEQEAMGFKSGFKECWKQRAGFSEDDFARPHILDLWDFRKKDAYFASKKYFMAQLSRSDLEAAKAKTHTDLGLSRVDRQEKQLICAGQDDPSVHLDVQGLRTEYARLVYPLHFIDFETSAVAIPFSAGRRPYEQVAFQFSHHIVYEDGSIAHQGQWLDSTPGFFPNFEFVRRLKAELEQDQGSIFRYSNHENTVLRTIRRQLRASAEADAALLCTWIETITHSTGEWTGERNMVDLWDWVKKYYFAPETKDSNSIKYILPAILNNSPYLQQKYTEPRYGTTIPSLNFTGQVWVAFDETGKVINPYKQLEPVFAGIDESLLDELVLDDDADIKEGGAAMMAYAQMQFSAMQEGERAHIRQALLRYCELDTLAMVMIWEDWKQALAQAD